MCVCIGGDLPAAAVDGVETGAHLLHRLVAGDRPQRRHIVLRVQELPQAPRPHLCQRMLDAHRATQPQHVLGRIGPRDPVPAGGHQIDLGRRGSKDGVGFRFGPGAGFVHQSPPEFAADGRVAVKRS